jgi:hypothetical protein
MVKILNILELNVTRITPSGLELQQRYSKCTKIDIISSIQAKRRKITLRKAYEVGGR